MQFVSGETTGFHSRRTNFGSSRGETYIHMSAATSSTSVVWKRCLRTLESAWIVRPGGSLSRPGNAVKIGCRPNGRSRAIRNAEGGSASVPRFLAGLIGKPRAGGEEKGEPPGSPAGESFSRGTPRGWRAPRSSDFAVRHACSGGPRGERECDERGYRDPLRPSHPGRRRRTRRRVRNLRYR